MGRLQPSRPDRYARSTWEPKSSFNPPDEYGNVLPGTPIVLQHWYEKKKSMTGPDFRNYCQKHEDRFVEAIEKAQAERLVKLVKREKKRQKATARKKRASPIVSDKHDDDEPTPSRRSQERISPKNTAPPEVAREGRDPISARHPRRVRKSSIVQSESSLSESDLTEDLMMGELDENKITHESTGAKATTETSKPRLGSAQSNRTPSKPAATPTNSKPAVRPSRNKSASTKVPQTSSGSPADINPQITNPQKDVTCTNPNRSPERTDTLLLASARRKSTADGSTRSVGCASSERSSAPTPSTGIQIVNQPKTQLRSEWKNGKSQFSTLHYRAVTQKRSRNEGTPDPAALEIVNGPSSNLRPKARAIDDVLDPNGQDYPVGDPAGLIPHKYRKPPLTCSHWLYKPNGCYKSDEQCDFAHRNTGWIVSERQSNGKPTQINRNLRPQSEKANGSAPQPPGVLRRKSMPQADAGSMCPPQHIPSQTPPNVCFPPPPPPPIEFPPPEATCEKLQKRIHSVCKLDFQDMFARNDSKGATTLMDLRAFLVFHPEQHSEELEIITRWLLMHHVQVAGIHYQGAWAVFQQQIKRGGSGVVIEGIEYDPALSNAQAVCRYAPIEVFPVGGFIYITDEVLEREPLLALRIVELFFEKIVRLKQLEGPLSLGQQVDDATLLWRLCVRPELMEHLIQYCEEHEDELKAGDADMQSRAQLYRILAETKYIEQDDPSEPLSLVPDKFPILSERRIIADCEPVDYFNTLARSQEDANISMIRYYAGLQVDMRRDYRHFFIVHIEPTAPGSHTWEMR
ncbi:hypothetical protein TW65_07570 [Stemphylium lycopersici]|uniref:C3H1-type domain-containing protein n=1 Tax=Stemphylium lycopersici TaxID=183478 RepID=A0A364MX61_STELY|nr:hypothetical protein TW65_07570 [Stemphylium lycopersici]RAR06117.1 hypothetical protein DDE83_007081 [Stemphylium lycopersici]